MGLEKLLSKVLEQFYPPAFRGVRTFLGNGLFEWIFLAISLLGFVFLSKIFLLFSLFWIENFFFWLIPLLTFQFYHWKAYNNKITLEEYLEIRKLHKLTKQLKKNK